ncbi:MAG: hypothetical protein NWE93_07645 [Candidatus Bathyarchaeota archaeon]|nr:hypothetical protein [Candidatus Bathyarchaeota archaeon]
MLKSFRFKGWKLEPLGFMQLGGVGAICAVVFAFFSPFLVFAIDFVHF